MIGDRMHIKQAVDAVRKDAESGDSAAAFSLGFAFAKGIGVPKNSAQAEHWYRMSADNNYVPAAINLGVMYLQGTEWVMKDVHKAVYYFQKAADLDSTHAVHVLGMVYQAKGEHGKSISMFERGAQMGDHHSQYSLGRAFDEGRGVPQDHKAAIRWLTRAAENGNVHAQINLGVSHMTGRGTPKNPKEAAHWFRLAADTGNPSAQLNLGVAYLYGRGVVKCAETAASFFRESARQGVQQAQRNLAILYKQGLGVTKNLQQASYWAGLAQQNTGTQ
jgi:hypothetical protein